MKLLQPLNPFTLVSAGEYPLQDFATVTGLIVDLHTNFKIWRQLAVAQRVKQIQVALQYFHQHKSEIAEDITRQMGKPISQAENEIKGFLERSEYLLSIAEATLNPEILPPKPGFQRRIEHEPLGVVFVIAPWNYPLLTAGNGIVTALLAGNTVLLKHSSLTPAIGEHFAKAFGCLGNCENILQNIVTDHGTTEKIISEGNINHVVFTGSVAAGHRVQSCLANRINTLPHFIDANLELGGKDGAYVAEDADLNKAAEDLVDGAMYNAGQSCCGIERVYVHKSLFLEFVEKCKALIADYVLGDPMDRKTNLGPLSSANAAQEMQIQIAEAQAQGARILAGGQIKKIGQATFFEPTLIINVNNAMRIMQEENFGPLLPILAVDNDEQAISYMNDTPYGLTAVLYSSSIERAEHFAREMHTGTVFLNRCDYLDPALPWTGVRDSGRGTTLSKYGFYGLTRRKAIHFRLP